MEIISELTRPVIDAAIGLIKWQHSTQMCSAPSHAFLYVLIASSTAIAVGGCMSGGDYFEHGLNLNPNSNRSENFLTTENT